MMKGQLTDPTTSYVLGIFVMGYTHSMTAEFWGVRDGLTLAYNLNICKLLIEINTIYFFFIGDTNFVVTIINT